MNEAQKAEQLIGLFNDVETPEFDAVDGRIKQTHIGYYSGIDCALICAEQISNTVDCIGDVKLQEYWEGVKYQLNKIKSTTK